MKIKVGVMVVAAALVAGSAALSACAGAQKPDEKFTQSTEYDNVLQTDHGTRSWKKVSRAPAAIATPAPSAVRPPAP